MTGNRSGDGSADQSETKGTSVDRRTVLCAGATVGATASAPVLTGRALAHAETATGAATGTGTGGANGTSDSDGDIATKVGLPKSAPQLGNPNYTGMFLHVSGPQERGEKRTADACGFTSKGDTLIAYDATLIDRLEENHAQAETYLLARLNDDSVSAGKLFVVNDQRSCGQGERFYQVTVEEVGASKIDTPEGVETAGTGGTGDQGGDDTTQTKNGGGNEGSSTGIPGFGVLTGAVAVLGAAAAWARRNDGG